MLSKSKKFLVIIVSAASCIMLTACSQSKKDLIVGKWKCNESSEIGLVEADIEYLKDGRSSAFFEVVGESEGVDITFSGTMAGIWSIENSTLTEELSKVSILNATANGQQIPLESFGEQVSKSMVNIPITSEIELLTEKRLLTHEPDSTMTCSRR